MGRGQGKVEVGYQRGKIAEAEVPLRALRAVREGNRLVFEEAPGVLCIAGEERQFVAVGESELERLKSFVKAKDPQGAGDIPGGAEKSKDVGRGAEADVPNDKFAAALKESLAEIELADIQRFRFGDGANDRMEGLGFGYRVDAVRAAGQAHQTVARGVCGRIVHRRKMTWRGGVCPSFLALGSSCWRGGRGADPRGASAVETVADLRRRLRVLQAMDSAVAVDDGRGGGLFAVPGRVDSGAFSGDPAGGLRASGAIGHAGGNGLQRGLRGVAGAGGGETGAMVVMALFAAADFY